MDMRSVVRAKIAHSPTGISKIYENTLLKFSMFLKYQRRSTVFACATTGMLMYCTPTNFPVKKQDESPIGKKLQTQLQIGSLQKLVAKLQALDVENGLRFWENGKMKMAIIFRFRGMAHCNSSFAFVKNTFFV